MSFQRKREAQIRVFNEHFHKLVIATQSCVSEIADKCLSRHLITSSTQNEIIHTLVLSPENRARKLLTAIRECMEHQDDCFKGFLEILDELMIFKDLAKEIRLSLEKALLPTDQSSTRDSVGERSILTDIGHTRIHSQRLGYVKHFCSTVIVTSILVLMSALILYQYLHGSATSSPNRWQTKDEKSGSLPTSSVVNRPNHQPQSQHPKLDDDFERLIFTPHQSGANVVDLCIKKLQSPDFNMPSDNKFMRRIAYVMTEFGKNIKENGGIWQLSYSAFMDTMDHTAHKRLPNKYMQIYTAFGIDWKSVKYKDLDKPFYSALAARLYLSNFAKFILPENQIEKQAEYWKFYYMAGEGNTKLFVNKVIELENM